MNPLIRRFKVGSIWISINFNWVSMIDILSFCGIGKFANKLTKSLFIHVVYRTIIQVLSVQDPCAHEVVVGQMVSITSLFKQIFCLFFKICKRIVLLLCATFFDIQIAGFYGKQRRCYSGIPVTIIIVVSPWVANHLDAKVIASYTKRTHWSIITI